MKDFKELNNQIRQYSTYVHDVMVFGIFKDLLMKKSNFKAFACLYEITY